MTKGLWRVGCALAVVGMLVGVVSVAEGYILPVRYFLKLYVKQRAPLRRLKIAQTTTTWRNGKARTVEERLYIRVPAQIRLEKWFGGKREQVDIWSGTEHLLWRPGAPLKRQKRKIQHRLDLFAVEASGSGYANITTLMRYMRVRRLGVKRWNRESDYLEQRFVRLTWFQFKPTVVIGGKNQLWINKRRAFPVRYMAGVSDKGAKYDLRFLDYHFQAGHAVYPGRIVLYRDGRRTVQTLAYRVEVGASVPQSLFERVK